jgi:Flp pilus assembly pilin Flp
LQQFAEYLKRLGSFIRALAVDQRGATATEYGVLLSFLALVVILAVTAFGQALNLHYMGMTATLRTALGIP